MKENRRELAEESVHASWICRLPGDRQQLFDQAVGALDASYTMMSITLDEAIRLRSQAQLVQAREQTGMCAQLSERLTVKLLHVLGAIQEQAKHLSQFPTVLPLARANFRHKGAREAASWQSAWHILLPSTRFRFSHKLRSLQTTVEGLSREFQENARDIADNTSTGPGESWQALDHLHFDLNTCLREAIVVLKSFLRAAPQEIFLEFQQQLHGIRVAATEAAAPLPNMTDSQRLRAQLFTPLPPRY